ncbi:unnamed protein product [Rotaria sp. Silwood2]|nr:unnamed protein product [Rotaria sp. Silwood2]CAF4182334.1 unnamed protein product [Rotaria sp. Silwood2]
MYLFICQGLMFNARRAQEQNNIFYRDAPIFLHIILAVLYLEKEPFRDLALLSKWIEIDKKNDERLIASADIDAQYWIDVIFKIRQYNKKKKKLSKQTEKDHRPFRYQLLHEHLNNININVVYHIRYHDTIDLQTDQDFICTNHFLQSL